MLNFINFIFINYPLILIRHDGKLITVERDLSDGNNCKNGNMASDKLNCMGTVNKNIIKPLRILL